MSRPDYAAIADLLDDLPALVRLRRKELGTTRADVAKHVGVSVRTIWTFETSRRGAHGHTISQLLRWLAAAEPQQDGDPP